MSNDEGETLDFGEMEMPEEMPEEGLLADAAMADEEGAPIEEFSPAEPAEEEEEPDEEEQLSFLDKLLSASPFTVMLGLALLAVVIAVTCLALELSSYKWDLKAKDYRGSAMAPAAVQSGLPNTIAAA